jgi:hypothetical protein
MESNGQCIGRMFSVDAETGRYEMPSVGQDHVKKYKKHLQEETEMAGTDEEKKKAEDKMKEFEKSMAGVGVDLNVMLDPKADPQRIKAMLEKLNSRRWNDKSASEKALVGVAGRANAHTEWSKQDPQGIARTTGRFSYINEGYDKITGATIDMGLTESGKAKLALIQTNQASRMHSHSKATLMFRHANEFKQINAGAYNKVLEDMKDSVQGMTPDQIRAYVERASSNIPKLSEEEIEKSVNMLRGTEKATSTEKSAEAKKESTNPENYTG